MAAQLMKRFRTGVGAVLVIALAVALTGCSNDSTSPSTSPGAKAADKVSYLTAFGAVGRDAFIWVAKEKGFFKDANIDINIQLGAAVGDNLKNLSAGKAQFAALDLIGAWILAGKGTSKDFTTVAVIHQQTLVSIIALQGGGITTPKDLEGKKVGMATGSVNQLLFPAYAKLAGIDPAKVVIQNAAPPQLPALLASKKVDALSTFLIGQKGIEKAAGGTKSVVLPYSQYLPDLVGNGLVTTKDLAKNNPDLAGRFRDAALKGLQYAIQHPDEAADILKKAQPTADITAAKGEITLMTPYVTPADGKSPIGSISEARVTRAIAILQSGGLIPAGLTAEQVVDFNLVPKAS
jgi:NitT/TauT family transport system substrate-binding protein